MLTIFFYICCQVLFLKVITITILCDCCVHVTDIIITLIIIQLAKAELLNFSSIHCLFCRLFIVMTDVYCSKIIMEFDTLFRNWYEIYKNTKRNKLDNLKGLQLLKGYQDSSPRSLKTSCQNNQWIALFITFSKLINAESEHSLKKSSGFVLWEKTSMNERIVFYCNFLLW